MARSSSPAFVATKDATSSEIKPIRWPAAMESEKEGIPCVDTSWAIDVMSSRAANREYSGSPKISEAAFWIKRLCNSFSDMPS